MGFKLAAAQPLFMSNDPTILWLAYAAPCCTMLSRRTGRPPSIKVGPVHSKSKLFRHGSVSMKDMKAKAQNHHLTQPLPNPRLSLHTGEASAQQDNVTSHGPVWPTCPNFSRSSWPFSWISELQLLIAALMTPAARRLRNFALPSLLSAKFPKA